MDIKSMLLVTGALIGIIALFLYFKRKEREKRRLVNVHLDNLGKAEALSFYRRETWGAGYALGLDTTKQVLMYTNSLQEMESCRFIKLADLESCSVVNAYRDVAGSRVIDQVRLELTFKNTRSHQHLLFYDKAENMHFTNELLLAEKWKTILTAKAAQ